MKREDYAEAVKVVREHHPRKPQQTGKNRFTAAYDEYYKQFTVKIELGLFDDQDEPPTTTKTYWRYADHEHWVEEFSGKIVMDGNNTKLWAFLNGLVANLSPDAATVAGITAQVRKAR